ncbi:bifunctional hydroxymethylpyrimidine kinase/phosphomethylpyrimidine kinase [Paenibacillus sp. GYB003]|uniref:bifunctional hydroxymethylpyrimidine kinase/phosphomethylpyrimidine kinase n=1 Tax=Paenibacillus sp. GYB003 TaxID=2994392 RepID=UPI002F96E74C
MNVYKALTIAGSDSGGGAGIQADLKTFQELGVFGMSAITALTSQNTLGVQGVFPIPPDTVGSQIDSVLSDIGADAIKTGMLFSADIIALVAEKLKRYGPIPLVVDPVMIAKGGAALLQREAVEALRRELLPVAAVLTPNVPEACALLGSADEIRTADQAVEAAKRLHELGPRYIFLKGGHMEGDEAIDVLYDGTEVRLFASPRIRTKHTHGTGCTTASAIAAGLAKGLSVVDAVAEAKRFITAAIGSALDIGGGIGPTNHAAFRLQSAGSSR